MSFKHLLLQIKNNKVWLLLVGIVFIIDRITKVLTLKFLLAKGSVGILPFFSLTYVENTGSAFGLFQNANLFLLLISLLILVLMFIWRKDILELGSFAKCGYYLIVAGALGNIYDRIMLGYVVDFLDFHVWPVFNIADSSISIGAVLIALSIFKESKRRKQ
ncbi:MAG: signal peptidase II [Elusimicrobiaceae bacterium]|nr:signal peptidase II [Elusimicrobiaceae bacterium]